MAGPYDTYDYSRSIQGLPAAFIAGQGRIQQAQRDREEQDRQMRMFQMQQDYQLKRDQQRQTDELAQIKAREQSRTDALRNASREERETQYLVAYPKTTVEELKKMTDAELISGINKSANSHLKDLVLNTDAAIAQKMGDIQSALAAKNASDTLKINEAVAQDPAFLAYVQKNVAPGWFFGMFGAKGEQFAKDFATGKATVKQLAEHATNQTDFWEAYSQSVMRASQGMTDKNGQPILDPANLSDLQNKFAEIGKLEQVKTKYLTQITDPEQYAQAIGVGMDQLKQKNAQPAGTFIDKTTGRIIPGTPPPPPNPGATGNPPPAAAPAQPSGPETMQFQSIPSSFAPPSSDNGPSGAIPSYIPPSQVSANSIPADVSSVRQPTLGAYIDPSTGQVIRPPGSVAVPPGSMVGPMAAAPMPALQQNFMSSSQPSIPQQNLPAVQAPAAAPGNGMPVSQGLPSVQAPADAGQAQQAAAIMMKVLGTTDLNVRQKSVDLARIEGMSDTAIKQMFFNAAHGDPTSLQRIRTYVQRAQTGQMMTPPAAYPAATAP